MFNITVIVGDDVVCTAKLKYLPRIGERLSLHGYVFEVTMVTYHFADGTFDTTPVDIDAKVVR